MNDSPALSLINGLLPANSIRIGEDAEAQEHSNVSRSAGLPTTPPTGWLSRHIHIQNSRIQAVDQHAPDAGGQILNGAGCFVLPGFIDLHVHGGVGADTMDADPTALQKMARFFARHGVTAFCPTTMTAPHEEILAAIESINGSIEYADEGDRHDSSGARILGAHVEGPYISSRYPGAQQAKYIRQPNIHEFQELLQAGSVKMITLAPEELGADELIALAQQKNVVVVLGHTNASYEESVRAVQMGTRQATHTFNAMNGLHHREPGTLGAVLSLDEVDAQLIADNIHVHPAAMKILSRCKGIGRTILITDAMQAAGLPEGEYALGGQTVIVKDGACRLVDGTLAGSVLTMDMALVNFMHAVGYSLEEAWPTTSRNAARSLGLGDQLGAIRPDYWADLVMLDQNYGVVATIVAGQIVYLRDTDRLVTD